ncbi:MAG: adenosylcobinamide-GDP ribazoletransferase [Acidimicrobiales bacterium]
MRSALAFLTPLGGPAPPRPVALAWFPVVGAGLGLVLGVGWWVADGLWPPLVSAALVVGADLALTGMLHLDGLADSADGLLAHGLDRGRRLEVMAQPDVGAFALGTVVTVMALRVTALASLAPAPLLLAALWSLSRTTMAVAARILTYARPGGLASAFLGGRPLPLVVGGGLLALALSLGGGSGAAGVVALATAVIAAAGVFALAVRRLGGFTGDVLGAAGMVAETVGLVVAAARW